MDNVKKSLVYLFLIPILLFSSCGHTIFDDFFAIHEQIDELKEGNEKIRERIENMNHSILTISTLVDILNKGYYIEKVSSIEQDGQEIGKQFLFSNGQTISIFHGKDGYDGHTPLIGVGLMDGVYYWTIDGEWLCDEMGNMVPIVNEECKNPQLTIRSGYWYMSYDGGDTWKQLGRATGEEGLDGDDGIDHIIVIDDSSKDGVSFILADGSAFFVPYFAKIKIYLDMENNDLAISGGETIHIGYSLSAHGEDVKVIVSSDGAYRALLEEETATEGRISITCPRAYKDGFVNVVVYSKSGVSDIKVIRFYERQMLFEGENEYLFPAMGGTFTIPFEVNFEYAVRVDENCLSWLSLADTKSGMVAGQISLSAKENMDIARTGLVHIDAVNGAHSLYTIVVKQPSSKCSVVNSSFVVEAGGGTFLSYLETTYGASVVIPDGNKAWLKCDVLNASAEDQYVLALTVNPNDFTRERSSTIYVFSEDGKTELAELHVLQAARRTDLKSDMIFVVRPNYSNDFTAYLPINLNYWGNDTLDCFIDWGDGTSDHILGLSQASGSANNVSHHYENLSVGRTFDVIVSGTVPSLCSDAIPEAYRSSVVEIKQWGKTGLKDLCRAFSGFSGLETLPLDDTGAFSDVENFSEAFCDCPRLITISPHLLDYAKKATNFSRLFYNCSRLVIIPDKLFGACENAQIFDEVFSYCRAVVSIPETLFYHCSSARNFNNSFYACSRIKSIPGKLFADCHQLSSVSNCFGECNGIITIPGNLFSSNSEIENFSGVFSYCNNLESVPHEIFDNNRRVLNFSNSFSGCINLLTESAYTLIDNKKVHLYERILYPDQFLAPNNHSYCFSNCFQMPDWESIPKGWSEDY